MVGVPDGARKIKVAVPAERGKANRALCELLAELLEVRRSDVQVKSGRTSRHKRLFVAATRAEVAMRRLAAGLRQR